MFVLESGSPKGTLKDNQGSSSPHKSQYMQKQSFPDESRKASSTASHVRTSVVFSELEYFIELFSQFCIFLCFYLTPSVILSVWAESRNQFLI